MHTITIPFIDDPVVVSLLIFMLAIGIYRLVRSVGV